MTARWGWTALGVEIMWRIWGRGLLVLFTASPPVRLQWRRIKEREQWEDAHSGFTGDFPGFMSDAGPKAYDYFGTPSGRLTIGCSPPVA